MTLLQSGLSFFKTGKASYMTKQAKLENINYLISESLRLIREDKENTKEHVNLYNRLIEIKLDIECME